ncbi:hypothetical protein [Virgibacillus oceani]|uniref:Uncharacterized protein n=1 Tax=Virgibacillus oceani TaxID=1479511 RepID=A0A917HMH7_9BACI|nr:hypothetical protein [Virgibacillus oceani]GGG84357.1 hypothetical protein GCM10011398_32500 [Virgibacillus oceani]
MDNQFNEKKQKTMHEQSFKGKSFQEISDEIAAKPELKERQPTPQPKDFDEIEY